MYVLLDDSNILRAPFVRRLPVDCSTRTCSSLTFILLLYLDRLIERRFVSCRIVSYRIVHCCTNSQYRVPYRQYVALAVFSSLKVCEGSGSSGILYFDSTQLQYQEELHFGVSQQIDRERNSILLDGWMDGRSE
jgi:hypothetical protein